MTAYKMYIGGAWVNSADGKTREITDPANGETIATVPEATAADVDKAVKAARHAFDHTNWGAADNAVNRAQLMMTLANKLREKAAYFAQLDTRNCGKPLGESEFDVADAANCLDHFAGMATKVMGETVQVPSNMQSIVVREPIGVAAQIVPWNYPLLMGMWKLAPAMAAGCTIVMKPSELTPLSTLELAKLMEEAGIPAGVVNIVTGVGEVAGVALSNHPDVDKIAFTGGTDTGMKVMAAAAKGIKKVTLELGGKNPAIVFADADLDKAIEWIAFAGFANQGEVCSAGSRILVERSIYNTVVERVADIAKGIKLGHGLSEGVKMGPVVSHEQYDKVMKYIGIAKQEGSTLVCGGAHPEGAEFAKGNFIEPTIFSDVAPNHTLFRDEVFGPVMSFTPFDTEEEAVALANDTEYGLAAGVFTENITKANRVTRKIKAGILWVNCYHPTFNELPWGGYKKSGIGRELGKYGLEAYLETKQININLDEGALGWY
jgi:betaine-aldehyde dehydrogenase